MFLDVTKRRNPSLITTGLSFHQSGAIPPNTYVIDVDSLKKNTQKIVSDASGYGMELYFMTKQLGRIPQVAEIIAAAGIKKAVAVDFDEGKVLADRGISIGNIGHLVQPGKHQWREVLSWKPEVVTIFSFERAKQLSEVADSMGIKQDILLKVVGPNDKIYEGQEGGILIEELSAKVDRIRELPGIKIVGVTSFPNLQLAEDKTGMVPTANLDTLLYGVKILEAKGISVKQVNGPGGTSTETIPFLREKGITHSEPGHALTGTTPIHAYKDLPEKPAIIYVSEVSHESNGNYQVIAGGYYGRSNMEGCLIGHDPHNINDQYARTDNLSPEVIDYYGKIKRPSAFRVEIGDTAIFAFRTQIFVTRAHVALVEGIQSDNPKVIHLERKW